jgi:hypothetical protein
MWIHAKKRPTGETGVDAAFQPCDRLVRFSENGIHRRNLVIGMMRVAEGTRQVDRAPNTLERRAGLIAPCVKNSLKAGDQRLVGKVL